MKAKLPILLGLGGLALVTGLLAAAADTPPPPPAPATPPPHHGAMAARLHDHLAKALDLTAEQQAKFDELAQKQRAELEALRGDEGLSPEDRHTKAQAIAESYRTQRHALLTPEQQKKAGELRARMQRHMRGPGQPAQREHFQKMMRAVAVGDHFKDRIAEKLQLTDAQRDQLERLGREFRTKQREAMKAHHAAMRAVLTPEQQKKVDAWKEGRGHFAPGGPEGMPPPPPRGGGEEDEDDV